MTYDPNSQQHPPPGGPYSNGPYGGGYQQPQGFERQGSYGQPQYGQPQYGQPTQPPKNKRTKWWIIGVVAVVVIALATWGGITLFGKFGGARSPEAAVENYLASAASFDIVDAALGTAPSERAIFQDALMQMRDADLGAASGDGDEVIPSLFESFSDLESAVDVSRDGFEYETEEIAEGVHVVTITDGIITVDGDEAAFEEAAVNLSRGLRYEAEIASGASESEALELAMDMTDAELDIEFPYEYDVTEGTDDLEALPGGIGLVTVQEGSGWYVSQIMTGAHLAATAFSASLMGAEGWEIGDEVIESQPAESPESAGMQLANGILHLVAMSGGAGGADPELAISGLTQAERTVASLYLLPAIESFVDSGSGGPSVDEVTLSGDFEAFEYGGKTMILPDNLVASYEGEVGIELDGYCGVVGGSDEACLTDWAPYSELGWDELGIVVVKEDGGWLVSPYQTVEIYLETATERYLELREEGNLAVLYE